MTTLQAMQLAAALGFAAAEVIKALRDIGCLTCDPVLEPADAPDLLGESLQNRTDLARKASGTDRASVDKAFDK